MKIMKLKKKRLKEYIEAISKNGNWAGDFEMSTASSLFNINIIILQRDVQSYK